jgi:hypothetical protein
MSELYSTRAAARKLGVSEASIRRWSDAGLLPVQRVGRRGARRFSEVDLGTFAGAKSGGAPDTTPVRPSLQRHDHFATFYDSDAARMRTSVPFLRAGLQAGDQCFLVADQDLAALYARALGEGEGAGSGGAPQRQLEIRSSVGSSAKEAVAAWEDLWLQALGQGSTAIRVVGEMAIYADLAGAGELPDYEVAYDSVSKRYPVVTLCQYDVRRFSGQTVLGALRVHPDLFNRRISDFLL